MSKVSCILICIGVLLSGGLLHKNRSLKKDLAFSQSLIEALEEQNVNFISDLGRSTSQCKQLQATISDLKKVSTEDSVNISYYKKALQETKKTVEDLSIKLSRVVQSTVVGASTEAKVSTIVQNKDSVTEFSWYDNYISLSGIVSRDSVKCNVISRDTIVQVLERVPKKFLFFKYGTKYIKQSVQSTNPHTTLTFSSVLQFK